MLGPIVWRVVVVVVDVVDIVLTVGLTAVVAVRVESECREVHFVFGVTE